MKKIIKKVITDIHAFFTVITVAVLFIGEAFQKRKKINAILKNLEQGLTEEEKAFLSRDVFFKLEEELQFPKEGVGLYNRLYQMKANLHKETMCETDIQLLRYLYKKEKLKNIQYQSSGCVSFHLEDPYLSMLNYHLQEHFFMKMWVSMDNDHYITIKDWQKEQQDLIDLFYFLKTHGTITALDMHFSHEEFGYDAIRYEEGQLIGYLRGNKVDVIECEPSYLMNLQIEQAKNRKIQTKYGYMLPLLPIYMKQKRKKDEERIMPSEKNVLLANGQWTTACSQCINRTKQISQNGCTVCTPKSI